MLDITCESSACRLRCVHWLAALLFECIHSRAYGLPVRPNRQGICLFSGELNMTPTIFEASTGCHCTSCLAPSLNLQNAHEVLSFPITPARMC